MLLVFKAEKHLFRCSLVLLQATARDSKKVTKVSVHWVAFTVLWWVAPLFELPRMPTPFLCWLQYGISGIGSALCRHGHILHVMNIFGGEKYAYATYVLYTILVVYKLAVRFIWYDINCRYQAHFRKWVDATESDLHHTILGVLAVCNVSFPIPPFHKYAHRCGPWSIHCSLTLLCWLPPCIGCYLPSGCGDNFSGSKLNLLFNAVHLARGSTTH